MVNIYATHYNAQTAGTDLGVPMVLSEDVNKTYERVSVADVYKQILADITEALPHLSETASNRYQAVRSVSHALFARYNLNIGNYKEAL